jgi:hypothetical protein
MGRPSAGAATAIYEGRHGGDLRLALSVCFAAGRVATERHVSIVLERFFEMYIQDFDLVFARDTDPVDLFGLQHALSEQRQLLDELKALHQAVLSGRVKIGDIRNLGLEYVPGDERSPERWLPRLIAYLESKITPALTQ